MPEKIVYIVEALYKRDDMLRILCHKINWMAENSEYEVYVVLTEKPRRPLAYELSPKVHIVNFDLNFDDINKLFYYEKPFHFLKKQWMYRKRLKAFLKETSPKAILTFMKMERWCLWSIWNRSHRIVELRPSKGRYKRVWIIGIPIILNWMISFFRRLPYILPLKAMNTIVVDTNESKKSWKRTFANITTIRPPIVDFPENPVDITNNKVVAFGSFEQGQRFDRLIVAWEKIGRKYPEWRLQLYGNGEQEPYRDMIRKRHLSKSILCYPLPEDRNEKYNKAAILVQVSENDIYGGRIMEAMAYGIPCVAIEAPGGCKELIRDEKNGYLVKPNHSMDLTIKIRMLIHNEELRAKMGLQAREDMQKYNLDATMKQWIELLDKIKRSK